MFDTIPMVVDLTRNGEYTQKTNDMQISMLLKYYNSDILISQIDQKIANRNQFDLISPNLIDSFENNFNELRKKYPEDINNITDVRERLYIDIINKIQANCGIIDIVDLGGVNIYDLTSVLYSFFISDYVNNIIKLFANFIFTQRTALYNDLNLDQFKKDKDSFYNTLVIYGNEQKITASVIMLITKLFRLIFAWNTVIAIQYIAKAMIAPIINIKTITETFFSTFFIRLSLREFR